MKFIITGGCGFIGSHLIIHLIDKLGFEVINIDNLSYSSNPHFINKIEKNKNYTFINANINDRKKIKNIFEIHQPDKLMHLAAETHVDRSIENPFQFIETNIIGTYNLLEISKNYFQSISEQKKKRFTFHHISTDEVFGDLDDCNSLFTENTRYNPSSPYSASKASSDHLVRAWSRTFGLPTIISNCSNNYGPNQYREKLIPLIISRALNLQSLPIYGNGGQIRDWLYVEDHIKALIKISLNSKNLDYYNIGGNAEKTNLEVVKKICSVLDEIQPIKSDRYKIYADLINFVEDRPGHDKRYAIDTTKIEKDLNWYPVETFDSGIRKTINWYIENRELLLKDNNSDNVLRRRGLIKNE